MDWKKIQRVRELIERGDYLHSAFLNSAIEKDFDRFSDRLLRDIDENADQDNTAEIFAQSLLELKKCPVGAGHQYRDIVAEVFANSLGGVVDLPLIRREFPCKGGRVDIALPLRIESLSDFSLWDKWYDKYKISSIIVEVKNKKSQAIPHDVGQILRYIVAANLGNFGILVSRSGFRRSAIRQLQAISSTNKFLVLPFEQKDLEYLDTLHTREPSKCMEVFRRKATLLTQYS
jgi:hypothetical protein